MRSWKIYGAKPFRHRFYKDLEPAKDEDIKDADVAEWRFFNRFGKDAQCIANTLIGSFTRVRVKEHGSMPPDLYEHIEHTANMLSGAIRLFPAFVDQAFKPKKPGDELIPLEGTEFRRLYDEWMAGSRKEEG
tara:strand:- start:127 stop:522 length:396 start_codon:yes stop_codon:yes gene_type:complete